MLTLVVVVGSSCKKTDQFVAENTNTEVKTEIDSVSNESLIKFLSITLNVDKKEISYDSAINEFIIRGHKFNRDQVKSDYSSANVYQSTFGK
jgi:CRISPR/Cas system-associated protein Cas10 (large subunit of type III CRISPR-Cas system)